MADAIDALGMEIYKTGAGSDRSPTYLAQLFRKCVA